MKTRKVKEIDKGDTRTRRNSLRETKRKNNDNNMMKNDTERVA